MSDVGAGEGAPLGWDAGRDEADEMRRRVERA